MHQFILDGFYNDYTYSKIAHELKQFLIEHNSPILTKDKEKDTQTIGLFLEQRFYKNLSSEEINKFFKVKGHYSISQEKFNNSYYNTNILNKIYIQEYIISKLNNILNPYGINLSYSIETSFLCDIYIQVCNTYNNPENWKSLCQARNIKDPLEWFLGRIKGELLSNMNKNDIDYPLFQKIVLAFSKTQNLVA